MSSRSLERSEEKKMMDADVQGDYQVMSVVVNKRMLWPSRRKINNKKQTEIREEIQSFTPPSQRKSRIIPSRSVVSKRN